MRSWGIKNGATLKDSRRQDVDAAAAAPPAGSAPSRASGGDGRRAASAVTARLLLHIAFLSWPLFPSPTFPSFFSSSSRIPRHRRLPIAARGSQIAGRSENHIMPLALRLFRQRQNGPAQ